MKRSCSLRNCKQQMEVDTAPLCTTGCAHATRGPSWRRCRRDAFEVFTNSRRNALLREELTERFYSR